MQNQLPLLLTESQTEALPHIVGDVLAGLTLPERLWLGSRLPEVVGLRAEAMLAGLDAPILAELLYPSDVQELARIVEPYMA